MLAKGYQRDKVQAKGHRPSYEHDVPCAILLFGEMV